MKTQEQVSGGGERDESAESAETHGLQLWTLSKGQLWKTVSYIWDETETRFIHVLKLFQVHRGLLFISLEENIIYAPVFLHWIISHG